MRPPETAPTATEKPAAPPHLGGSEEDNPRHPTHDRPLPASSGAGESGAKAKPAGSPGGLAALRAFGLRFKSFVKSRSRLYARFALLREQQRERRHPTAAGQARAAYLQRYSEREKLTPREQRRLLVDFHRCQERFGADEFDYVLYDFPRRSDAAKAAFVTDRKRHAYYRRLNRPENKSLFKNKEETYRVFGAHFHRELLHLRGPDGWPHFDAFCERHAGFICKPRDGSCGKGIQVFPTVGPQRQQQFQEILRQYANDVIVEELIRQAPEMAAFHPSSVNTVRITTLFFGDRALPYHPFLRAGIGSSIVDNGGSGGILAAINPATGMVETAGRDETGTDYEKHPDTGLWFRGFQIPRWPELLALADELCRIVPTNRYTGWDFALTARGWILVEANDRGQFVGFQMMTRRGCLEEFEQILAAHGV